MLSANGKRRQGDEMKIELRVDSRPLSGLVREGFSESIMLHQD